MGLKHIKKSLHNRCLQPWMRSSFLQNEHVFSQNLLFFFLFSGLLFLCLIREMYKSVLFLIVVLKCETRWKPAQWECCMWCGIKRNGRSVSFSLLSHSLYCTVSPDCPHPSSISRQMSFASVFLTVCIIIYLTHTYTMKWPVLMGMSEKMSSFVQFVCTNTTEN